MKIAIALALAAGGDSAAAAQVPAPPEPTTLTLPSLETGNDRQVTDNGWKYYYFHKAGVSYEQAYADFADCYRFLPASGVSGVAAGLPLFTSWKEPITSKPEKVGTETGEPVNGGIVGALIMGMISGPLERRAAQSRMRRCMEPRGYVRYAVTELAWEQLIDGYSNRSIALQAKAASGPKPSREPETR